MKDVKSHYVRRLGSRNHPERRCQKCSYGAAQILDGVAQGRKREMFR